MSTPRKWVRFLRTMLAERQGWLCFYCGELMIPVPDTTRKLPHNMVPLDHRVPRSLGGKTSVANCVAACQRCNCAKGDSEEPPKKKGKNDE